MKKVSGRQNLGTFNELLGCFDLRLFFPIGVQHDVHLWTAYEQQHVLSASWVQVSSVVKG